MLRSLEELFENVPKWDSEEGKRWTIAIRIYLKNGREAGLISLEEFQKVNSKLLPKLGNWGVSEEENQRIVREIKDILWEKRDNLVIKKTRFTDEEVKEAIRNLQEEVNKFVESGGNEEELIKAFARWRVVGRSPNAAVYHFGLRQAKKLTSFLARADIQKRISQEAS